jgi:hypothetical protein
MNPNRRITLALSAALLTAVCGSAVAGPPLICHPYQCDEQPALPMSDGKGSSISRENVADRTIEALDKAKSTLTRMEVVRRAATFINADSALATQLFSRLQSRAIDGFSAEKPTADGAFIAGFFVATVSQLDVQFPGKPGAADGIPGWAWITKVL